MDIRVCLRNMLYTAVFLLLSSALMAADTVSVIPRPTLLQQDTGTFTFPEITAVYAMDDFLETAGLLKEHPHIRFTEVQRIRSPRRMPEKGILLTKPRQGDPLAANAYRLQVTPAGIHLTAHTREAMLNGILTLLQLAYVQPESRVLPMMKVEDAPRFEYRGYHLDVSSHFFPVTFLKKFIDLLSLYKLNYFQLQLADGPGWRLEIKKYPELTSRAAWRPHMRWKDWQAGGRLFAEQFSPNASGGYYTQDDMRELVAYAARRGITIIPAISFPGHSDAVSAAYPDLSCPHRPGQGSVFNVGREETFRFMEDVLTEMMDIFPSSYIHVNGEGADHAGWKDCKECQELMAREKLKDPDALQQYALKKVADFIQSKGRKVKGGEEVSHVYFDQYQSDPRTQPEASGGYLSLKQVYTSDPVPEGAKAGVVKQVQGDMPTRYTPVTEQVEYMTFPRVLALAENAWSSKSNKDWDSFEKRLQSHYRLLQRLQVNYYRPSFEVEITAAYDAAKQGNTIRMETEQYQTLIRYTIDGAEPGIASPVYTEPFQLYTAATIRAALFADSVRIGPVSELPADIHKAIGGKVAYAGKWDERFPAGGETALVDGQKGGPVHTDGRWQGFSGDLEITLDFERREELNSIAIRFMQAAGEGIFIPGKVTVLLSDDGRNFREAGSLTSDVSPDDGKPAFKTFSLALNKRKARFVRIVAPNTRKGLLFTDEVVIY